MPFDGFSDRLRHIIKFGKYSQKEAAERIGISEHSFTKYLNGRIPQTEILYKIALLYDTTMEWLLTGEETKEEKEINSDLMQKLKNLTKEDWHDLEIFLEYLKFRRGKKVSENSLIQYEETNDDTLPIAATKEDNIIYLPILGNAAAGIPIEIIELPQGEVPVSEKHKKYNSFIVRAQGDSMIGAGIDDGDLVIIRPQPVVENGEIALVNVDGSATIKYFYMYNGQCELRSANPRYDPICYSRGNISILGKVVEIIKQI